MEIANCAKCFGRRFHAVPSERAVHMKIDKTRREIISGKINNLVAARLRLLTNRHDFSFVSNEFKPVAHSRGENQTTIRKNHVRLTLSLECSTFNAKGSQLRLDTVKSILLGGWIQTPTSCSPVARSPARQRRSCSNAHDPKRAT